MKTLHEMGPNWNLTDQEKKAIFFFYHSCGNYDMQFRRQNNNTLEWICSHMSEWAVYERSNLSYNSRRTERYGDWRAFNYDTVMVS